MVQSVLGSLTLGYRPLWGRHRELAGVQLRVAPEPAMPVDAPHLLRTLDELWSADAPPLLLSAETPALLAGLLEHGDARDVGDTIAAGDEAAVLARLRRYRDAGVTDLAARIVPLGDDAAARAASRARTSEFLASIRL